MAYMTALVKAPQQSISLSTTQHCVCGSLCSKLAGVRILNVLFSPAQKVYDVGYVQHIRLVSSHLPESDGRKFAQLW